MKQLELIYQGLKDCKEIEIFHVYTGEMHVWDFYKTVTGYAKGRHFYITIRKLKERDPVISIGPATKCRRDLKRILKSIDPTYIKILEKV